MSEPDNNVKENTDIEESVNVDIDDASEKQEQTSQSEKKKGFFAGKQSSNETKKLTEEVEKLTKANEELKDHYMRIAAEYENYKRRTSKEMEAKYADAKCDTLRKLLPVIDNFDRAMSIEVPAECEAYGQGIKMIYDKLIETFTSMGVEEIKAVGETFDPELHYAVMHTDDESMGENVVAEVFEKGYKVGDKVLRYSMVKVAN